MRGIESALRGAIWDADLASLPAWKSGLVRMLRVAHAVGNDLREGQLTLRAMSLVYTTLLSLVPLLAVSFSVLKGFGVHNQIEPMLLRFLAPLGEKGVEITANIVGFVDRMKVGVLGALGVGMLFYTVVSLIQKIESAFNYTWHTRATRSLGQRFSNYLSVIMVGPILVFAALGITATVSSNAFVQRIATIEGVRWLVEGVAQLVPYVLVIAAFTFVYLFVPNTRVRLVPAFVGAVIAGIGWETAGYGFAGFVASSQKYTAIYSGFAILLLFMIWLYLSWIILLAGASIAFYVQHPEHLLAHRRDLSLSGRLREKLALLVMSRVAREHLEGRPASSADALGRWLGLPLDVVDRVLGVLQGGGLLAETADGGYLPGRSVHNLPVREVLRVVRQSDESAGLELSHLPREEGVEQVFARIEEALDDSLDALTVAELGQASPESG
ncbi:MAG: YihY/virulence factor BrkB family protein [Myxococcota bacterium]